MYTHSSSDMGEIILYITKERQENLKLVDLSKSEAPVSIGQAYKTAEKFLRSKFPEYKKFELYWITYRNENFSAGTYSAFDVSFYAWKDSTDKDVSVLSAKILMDGKPVDFMSESEWDKRAGANKTQ